MTSSSLKTSGIRDNHHRGSIGEFLKEKILQDSDLSFGPTNLALECEQMKYGKAFGSADSEMIEGCVMEIYFADHMADKKLNVIAEVAQVIKPFPKTVSDSIKWQQVQSFHETVNAPKHPIRNRLTRIPIDSPDLLRVIKEEGKV